MLITADLPITQQFYRKEDNIEYIANPTHTTSYFSSGIIKMVDYSTMTERLQELVKENCIELTMLSDNIINLSKSENDYTKILESKSETEYNNLPPNEINSFAILNFSYRKELKRFTSKKYNATSDSYNTYLHMRTYLAKLPIEHCAIEINTDDTIKITMSFKDDKLLMITKSINDENDEKVYDDEVMYSYFINRKLIASDVTNFQDFTKGFKEYIS